MIDKDEAIRLLRKEVANKGSDYVYDKSKYNGESGSCVYVYNGEPACIVGHAFADAGVNMSRFDRVGTNGNGITALEFADIADDDARQIFGSAQHAQDAGETWGTALVHAENMYQARGGTE